ncbi:MAG TPA: C13 family peptidase [Pseudomonas sp.]|nr:C13 family peptidase [Pseudomonas sp.]
MRLSLPLLFVLLLSGCDARTPTPAADALLPDGGRYHGELLDGRMHGQGRIEYSNGAWYEGEFRGGLFNGQGQWRGASGDRYSGRFENGLFHGIGELTYAGGGRYHGEFVAGRLHGQGLLEAPEGRYRGEFRADRYHGLGQLEWDDGSRYQGQFREGEIQGQGVRHDADGSRFSGQFEYGLLQGKGQFQGADGSVYIGEFHDDRFHGEGILTLASGETWNGQFRDGRPHGRAEYKGADGKQYRGEVANGLFEGQGVLSLPGGQRLSGTWSRGQRLFEEDGQPLPDPLEHALLEQGRLLGEALDALPASTPEMELYSLVLAGDGRQSVFLREAEHVSALLRERFAARGQLALINHRDHLADRVLATRENLRRALQTLAERTGPEDLLFIHLTSHGSPDHALQLELPRLELFDLTAGELNELLLPLADRYKVLVISACYSGGFIEPLLDEHTLLMTAARGDRPSFGCTEENEYTYFGQALYAEALRHTDDLEAAFALAYEAVAAREQAEGHEPSEPQFGPASAVLDHWRAYVRQLRGLPDEDSLEIDTL